MRKMFMIMACCCMLVTLSAGTAWADITEDFDDFDGAYDVTTNWTSATTSIMWEAHNAIEETSYVHTPGGRAVRFNDDSGSNEYLECQGLDGNGKDGGVGTVSFWYRHWDGDSSAVEFQLQIDTGSGYVNAGSSVVIDPDVTTYFQHSYDVNVAGDDIMIRIQAIQDAERLIIDDMYIGDYSGGGPTNTPAPTSTPTTEPTATPTNPPSSIIINEVDADTPGIDAAEFIELYDGGTGSTALDGYVVVAFNGNGDTSYAAWDLDGLSTDGSGYFVLGNSAVTGVDLVFANNFLQNGADAVALFFGDDTDFPNGTSVTTTNLIDAIVYDTNEGDDAGLLVLLNASEPQLNEDENSNKDLESNCRCPNGAGGARNTSSHMQRIASPGTANDCPTGPTPTPTTTPTAVVVTIYDIQYTTDPSGDSPYDGQSVTTTGIVTAFEDGNNSLFIQDVTGAWNGIHCYNGSGWTGYAEGDELEVTGTVDEQYGMTQMENCSVTVNSTGNTLPAFTVVTSNGMNDEQYEGVLCEIQNAIVTSEESTYGEWNIDDSSGDAMMDDQYTYTYVPVLNDILDFVRGPIAYSYSEFRMYPRYDADIQINTSPTATPTTGPTPTPTNPPPAVVINEIYHDTPGTDALSFVELYGPAGTSLDGFVIQPRNQLCSDQTAVDLTGQVIPSDNYFVVGQPAVPNVDLVDDSLGSSMQNGPCDSVWLVYGGTDIDGVRYGTGCGEGTYYPSSCGEGVSIPEPDDLHSIGRAVDGVDSDDNFTDFCWNIVSPGIGNTCYVPPTATPTGGPTATPTDIPTATPTGGPTATPTDIPTATPAGPTPTPTSNPIPSTGPMGLGILLLAVGALMSLVKRRK
ncbi:hypothetical protein K8T06_06430 [bacterium]|nr:hypothetical protein [bacterium]